ncbi:MAG: hypothetical protein OXK77_11420 [Gemmatimonadota bacterium]|nr:hypothetical protein [Gemmatimonadota bacterium]MDE2865854.1 hypothetical protein [Gemmatimonadota bacterium]
MTVGLVAGSVSGTTTVTVQQVVRSVTTVAFLRCTRLLRFGCLALAVSSSSCVVSRVEIESLTPRQAVGRRVETPLKAFLKDGRIVVFPDGVHIRADSAFGTGTRYSLDLAGWESINGLAVDDLLGLQSIQANVRVGETLGVNLAGAVGILAGIGLVAIIWECTGDRPCDVIQLH